MLDYYAILTLALSDVVHTKGKSLQGWLENV